MIRVNHAIVLDEAEIVERFVRSSGPGGQNVNKVATAVELRFNIDASSLPGEVKARLIQQAQSRVTADGVLVIQAREHRTQARNREAARTRLIALIRSAARKPRTRRPTRPTAASRTRRLDDKKKRGDLKRRRLPGSDD